MNNEHWKNTVIWAAAVALACTFLANDAGAAVCRLDWNGDFQIDESDYLVGDPVGGFYAEWYIHIYYPGYYPILFPGADSSRLDYQGDGTINQDDLMGALDAAVDSEGYYVEWYIFMFYPGYYPIFFPEYDVCPPQTEATCPAVNYIDVGGPDEFGEPKWLTVLDGKLYFGARTAGEGRELHVYDPATGLVTMAADISPGILDAEPWDLFVHLGKLYFRARGADFDDELYVYDPATPGTATKIDVNPSSFSMPRHFLSGSDGRLFFQARTANDGAELHAYDPATGQVEYWDLWTGIDQYSQPYAFQPRNMVEYNGKIYMSAVGPEGREFYEFDLTSEQATRLSNIAVGYGLSGNGRSSYPADLFIFNDKIFFNAMDDGAVNAELWIYDPAIGDLREIVVEPGLGVLQGSLGPAGSMPSQFTEWGGKLYFRAQQVAVGIELFVYDPATDLVTLAFDSAPGQYDYCYGSCYDTEGVPYPCPPCMPYGNDGHTDELTQKDDKFYYVATFDDMELWEYDPATGVGSQILDLFPGIELTCHPDTDGVCEWVEGSPNDGEPRYMTFLNDDLYFSASNASVGYELFIVDWAPENCP